MNNQEENYIEIKGARVNNLKNIDIKIPRDKFIAITGVSGSGKSSLAFDTLYATYQPKYVWAPEGFTTPDCATIAFEERG